MSDPIFEATEMDGLAPEKQAAKAIAHTLRRIQEHKHVAWYCGVGTQTFALLTEAFATLTGQEPKVVRHSFKPIEAENPVKDGSDEEPNHCSEEITDHLTAGDVVEFVEQLSMVGRMELLQELLAKTCPRCGFHTPAGRVGPCACSGFRNQHRKAVAA